MSDLFKVTLDPVDSGDALQIRKMAESIWPSTYRGIISDEQIRFMLDWMYSPEQIAKEITSGEVRYFWITTGKRTGFLAIDEIRKGQPCFLHKIYVLIEEQGRGLGRGALNLLKEKLVTQGASSLDLRVNRKNSSAIDFYRDAGFEVIQEDCADIGNGFVMDDYIMRLPILPTQDDQAALH